MQKKEDLVLIHVVSGDSRKNSYPNGDEVYNNTVLYMVTQYTGSLSCSHAELIDTNTRFILQKESRELTFFPIDSLPTPLMDQDLIQAYLALKK